MLKFSFYLEAYHYCIKRGIPLANMRKVGIREYEVITDSHQSSAA